MLCFGAQLIQLYICMLTSDNCFSIPPILYRGQCPLSHHKQQPTRSNNTYLRITPCRERGLKQQLVKDNKRTKKILVVDDEHDINLSLKFVLDGGFNVDSSTNPLTALQNFKTIYTTWPNNERIWLISGN